jgi:hypothetical protein
MIIKESRMKQNKEKLHIINKKTRKKNMKMMTKKKKEMQTMNQLL